MFAPHFSGIYQPFMDINFAILSSLQKWMSRTQK